MGGGDENGAGQVGNVPLDMGLDKVGEQVCFSPVRAKGEGGEIDRGTSPKSGVVLRLKSTVEENREDNTTQEEETTAVEVGSEEDGVLEGDGEGDDENEEVVSIGSDEEEEAEAEEEGEGGGASENAHPANTLPAASSLENENASEPEKDKGTEGNIDQEGKKNNSGTEKIGVGRPTLQSATSGGIDLTLFDQRLKSRICKVGSKVGKGASASVYRGVDAVTLRLVALKEIGIAEPLKRDMLMMELRALEGQRRSLDGGGSEGEEEEGGGGGWGYYGAYVDAGRNMAYMVMEYMENGTVEDVVGMLWKEKEAGGISEVRRREKGAKRLAN